MAHGEIHVELSVNYADDPKVAALAQYGRDARGARDLYVQMMCYSKANMTDGVVPSEQLGKLVYPDLPRLAVKQAGMLAAVGLIETHPRGWLVTAYLKRNKSRAEIVAASEALAAVGSASGSFGNHQRWHVQRRVVDPNCDHCNSGKRRVTPIAPDSGDQIGSDRSETETETETTTIAPAKPPRAIDPIWDAVMATCEIDQAAITASARGGYNRAVGDLRKVGATADDVKARAAMYRHQWPQATLTPTALAKHWAACEPRRVSGEPGFWSDRG